METTIHEWLSETSANTTSTKKWRDSLDNLSNESRENQNVFTPVPHMLMTGVTLKHGGKEGNHAVVPRYCMVRITRLEPLQKPQSDALVFAIRMGKTRKTIRSSPLELKTFDGKQLNLDFSFGFHYLHNLKPPYDSLRIYVEERPKKKSKEHKVLAYSDVNMSQVLQYPFDGEIQLFTPKEQREERRIEKREEKEQKKQEKEAKKREKQNLKEGGRVTTISVTQNQDKKESEEKESPAKEILKEKESANAKIQENFSLPFKQLSDFIQKK